MIESHRRLLTNLAWPADVVTARRRFCCTTVQAPVLGSPFRAPESLLTLIDCPGFLLQSPTGC
ncbi:hypothetical protein ASPCADRAFT_207953 [Aspergillus carbonarius ITEM 5010]|uniref:Uncharacterized protein n=1 Tax=Aspergillus carbonarius (strain ITEM 5010) TaxID=602072 RepID=A0A1R3RLW5_ASPC5|nr:hypothetical protein ASPCADRAFT_207953 [Aspergillus carbonarius ITEM 5010]